MVVEFKRIHALPRRWYRGSGLGRMSPRQSYILEQSTARFLRRPDAAPIMFHEGEIGRYEGVRFIESPGCPAASRIKPLPAPRGSTILLRLIEPYTTR